VGLPAHFFVCENDDGEELPEAEMKPSAGQSIEERVKALAEPILSSLGLELVEIMQWGGPGRALLRIYIDRPGGVTIEDCERASTYLGHALDVEDPIPFSYTLEVSSPGLDRPLKSLRDYQRAIGKRLRITLFRPLGDQRTLTGLLLDAGDNRILVEGQSESGEGQRFEILLTDIQQARLEIKW
jgi:ribosome maturation factor RimP